MATRKQTESALRKLVQKGSSLRAVAITGQWGCGKTHLVNAYFETSAVGTLLKASNLKYVYVSLFGLSTLQEVRRRISTVVIGTHAQRLLGVSKLLSQLAAPVKAVAGVELNLGGLGETTAALIEEKVTRQLVVCFDDLERASVAISASDLFGLISELTEQRECKCILIFNREKMAAEAKSKAATQEEKIFDLVLDYNPTTTENLVHGFADKSTREIAEPVFEAFENSNIRIMRRLAWVLSQLDETEVAHLDKVRTRLIRNAATLCLIKYACADTVPDVSVLCEPSTSISAMLGYANFAKEIPDHLRALLKGLDHAPADFDECIVGLLQDGALDEPKFERAVAKVCEEQRHSGEREEMHAIWESLRQGFAQNGAAFSGRLVNFLNRQHESILPGEAASLCELLLAVDPSAKSKALVGLHFAPFIRVYPLGARTNLMKQFPEIERLKIHESEPHVAPAGRRDLDEIFQSIAGQLDSWNPSDSRELDGFSDDEIEAFILAHRSPIAIAQFKNLVARVGGDQTNGTAKAKERQLRLTAILERIAARDPLFRYQIKTLMPQFS
jgi:hypothetical protein